MKHASPYPRCVRRFAAPREPFHIALIEPEIPPNAGNIARTCAATGTVLHLVGPLGFQTSDRQLKRAGLDYWESVQLVQHPGWDAFLGAMGSRRLMFFSAQGASSYTEATYTPGEVLVFGSESRGLDGCILEKWPDQVFAIPMRFDHVRSLNLATAAGIVLFEALRQTGCLGGDSR